jgi:hypothetical protein
LGACDSASWQGLGKQADADPLPWRILIQVSLKVEEDEARELKLDPDGLFRASQKGQLTKNSRAWKIGEVQAVRHT